MLDDEMMVESRRKEFHRVRKKREFKKKLQQGFSGNDFYD